MSRVFRHTVEWIVDGRPFKFMTDGQIGMLQQPAGEALTMTVAEWQAIAQTIGQVLPESGARADPKLRDHPNQGKPWTAQDDAALRAAWEAGDRQGQLAERFGRSRGAISSRLVHIGMIERE